MKYNPELKSTILTLCLLLFVTPQVVNAQTDETGPDEGVIAIHLLIDGLKYVDYFAVVAQNKDTGKKTWLRGFRQKIFGSWKGYYADGPKGQLVVEELTEGDYELISWEASAGAWGGTRTLTFDKEPIGSFRINDGRMTYAGKLTITVLNDTGVVTSAPGNNIYSLSDSESHFTMEVIDDSENDLKNLPRDYQGFGEDSIDISLLPLSVAATIEGTGS